jgi:hypothetical protein
MIQEPNNSPFLLPRDELIAQLSASLGVAKATDLVDTSSNKLGILANKGFSQTEALSILETISASPGLVGIVARCAKARVILRYNKR